MGFDGDSIKIAILAQESLAASSMAGIACMRPGRNAPFFVPKSIIIIAFLEKAIDFKALDRKKVEIIFLILPANEVEEAIIDTRLRRLLMEPEFLAAIKKQPSRREVLQLVQETEELILPPPDKKHFNGNTNTTVSDD